MLPSTINFIVNSFLLLLLLTLTRSLLLMPAGKKLFKKANKNETTVYYPILNLFVLLEIVEMSTFYGILLFVPGVNVVILCMMMNKLGKNFNVDKNFRLGLILLPVYYLPTLCMSDKQYKVNDEEYFKAMDNAKGETINLMTQEEIDAQNKEKVDENNVDSIFKSEISQMEPVGPYKAGKVNVLNEVKKTDEISKEENIFAPIDVAPPLETVVDEKENKTVSKFTSEIEKEEDIEIVDL